MSKANDYLSDQLISRHPKILETTLDEEIVLMSIEFGQYYGLSGTARRIWELLEEPLTFAELTTRLAAQFEVETSKLNADVDNFLRQMQSNGLILF